VLGIDLETVVGEGGVVGQLVVTVTSPPTQVGGGAVRGDAVEPGRELGVAAEALEATKCPEVRLLHHVACVLLVHR
jgi:hypothetical protein